MPDKDQNTQNEPRKRRKIALACERCRDRKIRCDGHKPACDNCQRRQNPHDQYPCIYINDNGVRAASERVYIQVLHDRILHLEGRNTTGVLSDRGVDEPSNDHVSGLQQVGGQTTNCIAAPRACSVSSNSKISRPSNTPGNNTGSAKETYHQYKSPSLPSDSINQHPESAVCPSRFSNLGDVHQVTAQEHLDMNLANAYHSFHDRGHSRNLQEWPGPLSNSNKTDLSKAAFGDQLPDKESPVNAMGTATSEYAVAQEGFYGTSSAISFFHQVQDTLQTESTRHGTVPRKLHSEKSKQYPQGLSQLLGNSNINLQDYCLPPRELADYLMDNYWRRVHCLFPIIHKPSFQSAYCQLWEVKDKNNSTFLDLNIGLGSSRCPTAVLYCALNAMMALGCNFTNLPYSQRQVLSDTLSKRSLSILLVNILDNGSLGLVQALLIVAQYLQSTDLPNRCWNVVGLALRAAQGLGLYIDSPREETILEAEVRRRTWHGCLMLDVLTGMTLGRPTITSGESDVPFPTAVDDEYLDYDTNAAQQPDSIFSENNFFVQTLKLYNILGETLRHVYNPSQIKESDDQHVSDRLRNSPMNTVLNLESAISDFESNMPSQLRWDRSGVEVNERDGLERQRIVLHTRLLHLKILLYRPVFHQVCGKLDPVHSSTGSQTIYWSQRKTGDTVLLLMTQRCAEKCVAAAQDLIALVDQSSQTNAAGAWWYGIFYIFSSAMVLILATLRLPQEDASPKPSIGQSWQQCLNYLDRLSPEHIAARKCAKTLIKMREQALATVTALNPPKSGTHQENPMPTPGDPHQKGNLTAHPPFYAGGQQRHGQSDEYHFSDTQFEDILWQHSGVPLPWDSQEEAWWGGLFDQS